VRTSPKTPLVLLAGIVGGVVGAFFVFYLGSFGGSGSSSSDGGSRTGLWIMGAVIVLLMVRVVFGVLGWWFRTYSVGPTELVIDEGVFTRRRRVVPYDRVQQVDTHQNLVAQLFTVSELRVATAIASGTENVRLLYLDTPAAAGLRTYILDRRTALQHRASPIVTDAGSTTAPVLPTPGAADAGDVPGNVLLALTPSRLALAAVTHSSLLIGAASGLVIGLWASAGAALSASRFGLAVLLGGGLVAAAVLTVLSGLMAVTRNLLERFGFTLRVRGDDLELRMGLLETRTITVPRRRVQQVSVVDNPVRRVLGLVALELHTASAGGEKTQFEVPLVARRDLDELLVQIMGDRTWLPPPLTERSSRARSRAIRRRVIVTAVLLAPPAIVLRPFGFLLFLAAAIGIPWGRVAHRRAGLGRSATLIGLSHGVLHHRTELVPLARVQSSRTHASPFQRHAGLATLAVDVAGQHVALFGIDTSPHLFDLDETTADELRRSLPRAAA
jgi:putative membrane protein